MPVWLPILKASLPYITQIVSAAIPAFTKPGAARTDPVIEKQIEELQAAATQNAETIRVLAEKLSQTLQGIDSGAAELEHRLAFYRRLTFAAAVLALAALAVAGFALGQHA
jgi:hypothetical protein